METEAGGDFAWICTQAKGTCSEFPPIISPLTLQDIYLEKKSHMGENSTCEEGEKEQWCQLYAPQFLEVQTIVYRDFIRESQKAAEKGDQPHLQARIGQE